MIRAAFRLCSLACALASPCALAQVYKCPDAKGKITYQESPCDANLGANKVNTQGTSGATFAPAKPRDGLDEFAPGGKGESKAAAKTAAPEAGTKAAAQAPESAPRRRGNADDRRFVSAGQKLGEVVARIGDPDKRVLGLTTRRSGVTYRDSHTDIYDPAPGDPETRTVIQYTGDVVQSVRREIAR